MKNVKIRHQKASDSFWEDEAGNKTQYSRLFPHEKLQEKSAVKLFRQSEKISKQLESFKSEVEAICLKIYDQYLKDKSIDKSGKKGNFTWYNFDRSIKVEIAIQERITFDEMGIQATKEVLNEFLDENIESKVQIIKDMVTDAFSTSNGKLDARKVMNLLRYEGKVRNKKFSKAMELLRDSIRRPDSKTYFRIWGRTEEGDYENVELNFSKI